MFSIKERTKVILVLVLVNYLFVKCDVGDDANGDIKESEEINEERLLFSQDDDVNSDDLGDVTDRNVTEAYQPTTEETHEIKDYSDDATTTDVAETVTNDITLSMIDNNVYKTKGTSREDIYYSRDDIVSMTEPTTSSITTRAMEVESSVPKTPDLMSELEITGQRNPKTENSGSKQPDKRNYDAKPRLTPIISKITTLKGWLEDAWLRPPAGILVPLRPMALNRALDVWNDITAGGLNVSDIVIVGYDSNGVNWRSRHNLHPSRAGSGERAVPEALSKLLLKYQGIHTDATSDGTMRALASAAKLVPYDSALFVVTDKGAGDPQRLPLALRALIEKRLKVYTIWTDPSHPTVDSETALQELRNISKQTEGDVLPYSLQSKDLDASNLAASETDLLQQQESMQLKQPRRGRLEAQFEYEKYDILQVRRGGGEAISLGVSVENGVTALRVYIEGAVEHAVLYPPNDGPQIDLYNVSSVATFSPASRTEGLLPRDVYLVFPGSKYDMDVLSVLPATPPATEAQKAMVGVWHLSVKCDTCDFRLHVSARTLIHLDVETTGIDTVKLRMTGPVASVRETLLVDEYGTELAKLPFNHTINAQEENRDPIVELEANLRLPSIKGSKVYIKIQGRDVQGEPFVRLSGPLHTPEVRLGRSASVVFPDSVNDLERVEELNSKIYNSQIRLNNTNGLQLARSVSQIVNQFGTILTTVQIGLSTKLYGAPGDNLQLHFEVTNYREQTESFSFGAVGELRFLTGINPTSQRVLSGQTVNVIVSATIPSTAQPGQRDMITFTAYGQEQTAISAYVYVLRPGDSGSDVWAPEVRHNFQGSCFGRQGSDCAQHVWSVTVVARDALGGILRLTSSPIGLMYDSGFISGSRDDVIATYRATCCAPRILINAVDVFGNTNSYAVDISNYITDAGIAAIVLGVFLAIVLIILIVLLIYCCVKRRRESREIPSYSTSSRNIS